MMRGLTATIVGAAIAASVASGAGNTRSLVFYGKATQVQFINHSDDRSRGNASNPFLNIDRSLPSPPKANTAKPGARAGDNALFRLKLYSDPKLTRSVGTAVYSCTFNFDQEAICDADLELPRGSIIASGPADLESGQFTLAVVGGTGTYLGARGQLTSAPGGKKGTTLIQLALLPLPG
jgi:hypothetical protein